MTYLERLNEELDYFEFQLTISPDAARTEFLTKCATNCRRRIEDYKANHEDTDTTTTTGDSGVQRNYPI